MDTNKATAKIVGALFIAAFLAYGFGNGLIESVLNTSDSLRNISNSKMLYSTGAIFMLLNSVVVAGIGIAIYPVLKSHNECIAICYLSTRIIESVVLVIGIISLLSLIPLSQEYVNAVEMEASYYLSLAALAQKSNFFSYQIAMTVLGIGSLFFCYLLYQSKLVPTFLSIWGLVGYFIFLTGALLEILGFKIGLILSIPGGLFEAFVGIWLLTKGFNQSAMIST